MNNSRVAALRHLHDKLKSGDYDGTDVMAAWIAVEDLACLLERASNEPPAVTGEAIDAARAALKVDTNVTYPSHVAARQVRHVIRELITAYERLHTLYVATCTNYCRERERAAQPPGVETWMVKGHTEEYGWVHLPDYAASTREEVETKVMDGACREGFRGTLLERLAYLQWQIVEGTFAERATSTKGDSHGTR